MYIYYVIWFICSTGEKLWTVNLKCFMNLAEVMESILCQTCGESNRPGAERLSGLLDFEAFGDPGSNDRVCPKMRRGILSICRQTVKVNYTLWITSCTYILYNNTYICMSCGLLCLWNEKCQQFEKVQFNIVHLLFMKAGQLSFAITSG